MQPRPAPERALPGVHWTVGRVLRHPFFFLTGAFLMLCHLGGQFGPIGAGHLTLWPGAAGSAPLVLPSGKFMLLYGFTWTGALLLLLFFPRRLSLSARLLIIAGLALAARLLLLPHPASDDIYRYLWEGRVFLAGENPYLLAPTAAPLNSLAATDPYHPLINHPDLSAIYPPAMILLFSLVGQAAYHPLAVKLVVLCFDLGTLGLLLLLLHRRGLPLRHALLYALNPVILYGFAGQGHLDSLQSFFLLAALVAHGRRRWGWMWLFAGAAVQVKYMAVVALPFLLNRHSWRWSWLAIAAILLPFMPFREAGPGLFATLIHFGRAFGVNGPFHGILRLMTGEIAAATTLCLILAGLLLGGLLLIFHRRTRPFAPLSPDRGLYLALGILILCLPTVHFWYLGWILPFVALYPSNAWMLLTLTAAAYFSATGRIYLGGAWELTWPYQVAQWLPFGLLFLPELIRGITHLRLPADQRPPASVSVIIPTRNEAAAVGSCVAAVRSDPAVQEVLVVDGGSTDDTSARATAAGAQVIRHVRPPTAGGGRGGQIAAGVAAAVGDLVAVVHADTRVAAGQFSRVCKILRRQPGVMGGALGARFDHDGLFYRLITAANDIRAMFLGISFGDQVQFFRRDAFLACGAYPNLPLMEDVELSLRLGRCGRQVYLFGGATVSVRRWERAGAGHALTVIQLFTRYLWQRLRGRVDAGALFHRYYGPESEASLGNKSRLAAAARRRGA
ncbi:MAG: glycosyltransferase [Desulfosarcinaceae bacterium]|nr:glycosyltransferase [Desulfosarcinaceae bacterium]